RCSLVNNRNNERNTEPAGATLHQRRKASSLAATASATTRNLEALFPNERMAPLACRLLLPRRHDESSPNPTAIKSQHRPRGNQPEWETSTMSHPARNPGYKRRRQARKTG